MIKKVQTDVLVVGGGAAGIAAAIGAAGSGAKVILAERNSFFGGKATAANVGTVCGLYLRNKSNDSIFACKGFAKDFALNLQALSNTQAQHNSEGLHYLPYHPFAFKSLCDSSLENSNVEVFLHTTLFSCVKEGDALHSLSGLSFDWEVIFEPKAVIDCSGEAIVSHLAGIPVEANEEFQAAAQVFALHNVESDKEDSLNFILIREFTKAIEAGLLSPNLKRISIVPGSLSQGKLLLKIALPFKITHQFNALSTIEIESRKLVGQLYNFLKENVSVFKNANLGEVSTEAGIRTGRRPIGKYTLTEADVLSCRKFDKGIANGAWPIEYWEPEKKVFMNYFQENDFYQIPADCLQSNKLTNLYFAGRNIGADNSAIASARVIGTCLQTGYAAGKLAAAKISGLSEELAIAAIRKEQIL